MALYRRGRIWYSDFYFQGKRVRKQPELRAGGRQRSITHCVCPRSKFGEQYLDFAKINKRAWLRDKQVLVHLTAFFGATLLRQIGPLNVEQYKQARVNEVSPATVNREVAFLKHIFNLAERWGAFRGINPVRMVKFFDEDNDVLRVLSVEEEERLLWHCSPYLQDLIVFAINTGLRAGDILNLTWGEVDLEASMIVPKVRKDHKQLEIPLNDAAQRVVHAWNAMKRCRYVFYNPEPETDSRTSGWPSGKPAARPGLKTSTGTRSAIRSQRGSTRAALIL